MARRITARRASSRPPRIGRRGFSDWSVIPEEFVDGGAFVVARVRQVVRGEASGISVEAAGLTA